MRILEEAEDFYVPVKKIWKEMKAAGHEMPDPMELLAFFKKERRFEVMEKGALRHANEEEMEKLGFYSGPRVKLRSRKITKDDMMRILRRHAQNMIDNLVKAYGAKPEDLSADEEDTLIDAMRRAKHLKEQIDKTE